MKFLLPIFLLCTACGGTSAQYYSYSESDDPWVIDCMEKLRTNKFAIYTSTGDCTERNSIIEAPSDALNSEMDSEWINTRKSLENDCSAKNYAAFKSIYKKYVSERDIDKLGTPKDEIVFRLGEPDMILSQGDQYVYGICIMTFKNNRLASVSFF